MSERTYRFAEFEFSPAEAELRTNGSSIRLQEKPLQVLLVLVQNPQRVVKREQLRDRMWGSDTFVDYEQGINVAIKKVRDALGDSAESPKFIQTVSKKGYRFLVPVEVADPALTAQVPAIQEPFLIPEAPPATSASTLSPRVLLAAITLAACVLAAAGVWGWKTRQQPPMQIRSLAVLPLRNLSPDPSQEYFADGITEELITSLAQSLPMRVISRTSVMRYRETNEPISQIARELGVQAIIEGAVAQSGDRVTVTVQLIDATEDRHLWAQRYDRKIEDLLAMEGQLSHEIAIKVGGTLSSRATSQAHSRPVDPQVYQLYLKGRYFWNKRTDDGVKKAAEYFHQAVDLDPKYARAYVGLADCFIFGQPPLQLKERALKAKEMATKALELDDGLGEAYATLGLLAENADWDWAQAEMEYKRAIELNPNYATAHLWYGGELALTGQFEPALEELKIAGDLDPLSLVITKDTGDIYYVSHRYDRAIEYFRKALEMDPDFVIAHRNLGLVYAQQGDFAKSVAELQKARNLDNTPDIVADLGYVYALSGKRKEAEQILRQLKTFSQRQIVFPDCYAVVYAGLGDRDKAFAWLEKAYREGGLLTGLKVDPRWNNLRSDARFDELMRRVRLAQ